MPGVMTGLLMAFTLSIDDFVISYFCSGPTSQTLPVLIYSMTVSYTHLDVYKRQGRFWNSSAGRKPCG